MSDALCALIHRLIIVLALELILILSDVIGVVLMSNLSWAVAVDTYAFCLFSIVNLFA